MEASAQERSYRLSSLLCLYFVCLVRNMYYSHVCSTPPPPLTACVPLQILAVPKGFSLNPAPPEKGKAPGMKNLQENEWLSDREREQERSERLHAARAAEQQHINANQASAMRRPTEHTSVRPYSAKAVSSEADSSPYAGQVRPGSGVPPVTVQAYANTMANRTPSRAAVSGMEGGSRTGSSSSNSKFVNKVKDATSALADEEQQMAQRVGAPSAHMLYPTAFKGARGNSNAVDGKGLPDDMNLAPGGPRGVALAPQFGKENHVTSPYRCPLYTCPHTAMYVSSYYMKEESPPFTLQSSGNGARAGAALASQQRHTSPGYCWAREGWRRHGARWAGGCVRAGSLGAAAASRQGSKVPLNTKSRRGGPHLINPHLIRNCPYYLIISSLFL